MPITKETFKAIEKVHGDLVDGVKEEMIHDANTDVFGIMESLTKEEYPFNDSVKMLADLVGRSAWLLTQIDAILADREKEKEHK